MRRLLFFFCLLTVAGLAHSAPWSLHIDDIRISPPVTSRSLAIYPLRVGGESSPRCRSLDAALMQKVLSIEETSESGDVNRLRLRNRGDLPVFIMAGEVLSGARQDRILQHDLWLEADSEPVIVSAFCVEHGRWGYKQGKGRVFESKSTLGNLKVRRAAMSEGGQQAVWESVDETNRSAGVHSPTQTLNAAYFDPKVSSALELLEDRLRDLPEEYPEVNGVAVQIGNRIVAVDVFPDRRIFRSLWPKLLRSYAMEAQVARLDLEALDRQKVRDFLGEVAAADAVSKDNPGEGRLYSLDHSGLRGEALVLSGELVHLQALSREKPRKVPHPSPSPWPPAIEMMKPTRPR